jgi:hypothetical protein
MRNSDQGSSTRSATMTMPPNHPPLLVNFEQVDVIGWANRQGETLEIGLTALLSFRLHIKNNV